MNYLKRTPWLLLPLFILFCLTQLYPAKTTCHHMTDKERVEVVLTAIAMFRIDTGQSPASLQDLFI